MPRSAMDYVEIDDNLPSTEIGELLGRLAEGQPGPTVNVETDTEVRVGKEIEIAAEDSAFQKGIMHLGTFTPFTCPECHGALIRIEEGKMSRFRCHTGHAHTDNALLQAVMESTGELLWQVIRSFEERVLLMNHIAEHLKTAGDSSRAEVFRAKACELEKRSKTFHDAAFSHESLSGDNVGQEPLRFCDDGPLWTTLQLRHDFANYIRRNIVRCCSAISGTRAARVLWKRPATRRLPLVVLE